jgi:asparagine synthase (glutamine-hydrolysing)
LKHFQDLIQLRDKLDETTCIAFSGGVDSSLLAQLVNLHGYDLSLISVSFGKDDENEDIKRAAKNLHGHLFYTDISSEELEKGLTQTIKTIEYDRIALLENAVGYYFIFKHAKNKGLNTVLSANGVDELYCGYDIFRRQYHKTDLNRLIVELTETAKQDKYVIDKVAKLFDVTYYCPFLENEFINYSRKIPLSLKIVDENDELRKHYIREQAIKLGIPKEIAYQEKRSLQYSSGLHKAIRLLARKNGFTNKKGKSLGYESGLKAYITNLKKEVG